MFTGLLLEFMFLVAFMCILLPPPFLVNKYVLLQKE